MGARNMSIAAAYEGKMVFGGFGFKCPVISMSFFGKNIPLNSDTVKAYEVLKARQYDNLLPDVARAAVGYALVGPIGVLAGVSNTSGDGVNLVFIQFKDGQESLLELNNELLEHLSKSCPGRNQAIITKDFLDERKSMELGEQPTPAAP